jgi:tetratricopeptide (TPR) repeat protein
VLGPEHPDLAGYLNNLATHYSKQGKYEQAEPLLKRAITIGEKHFGPEHLHTIAMQKSYTSLLETMKRQQ